MPLGELLGRKNEEERIEAMIIGSFRSNKDYEVKKAQRKVERWSGERPLETVTALLKHYDDEDEGVRRRVKETLMVLIKDEACKEAIMTDMVHPNRTVRKAVQGFLGDAVGSHAITYASVYEQTMLLIAMAKRKDVPVEDVVSLAELTQVTFMDGEVMRAIRDIGLCLDTIKHRYRSSEQLKDYLSELLRMAPDLSRMGVYGSSIEEPLRKAMKASRDRVFDDTSLIIEERNREFELRGDLTTLAIEVTEKVQERPVIVNNDLNDEDKALMVKLYSLIDMVTILILENRGEEAKETVQYELEKFLQFYDGPMKARVHEGEDRGAKFVLYAYGLSFVKLAAFFIPITAEETYQTYLRHLEQGPSIHVVMWPEVPIEISVDNVRQESDMD